MDLRLKRSQRSGGMLGGKIVFMLDARANLTNEERALVSKYGLGKMTLYDSEARKKRLQSAADGGGGFKALTNLALASLSLNVTIDSLTNGHHIECKEMNDLLGAEAAIKEGCENMKGYLDIATTFDGREQVIPY